MNISPSNETSSKGPAVRALRAQSDKKEYMAYMRNVIESYENIDLKLNTDALQCIKLVNNDIITIMLKQTKMQMQIFLINIMKEQKTLMDLIVQLNIVTSSH